VLKDSNIRDLAVSAKSQGEKTMCHKIIIAHILIIAFATSAFAQQTTVTDSQSLQQAESIVTQYADALNKGDGEALAATYAPDAIDISPLGKVRNVGTQVHDTAEKVHKMGLTYAIKVDDVEPVFGGHGLMVTTSYKINFSNAPSIPPGQGNILFVLERAGDSWKIRAVVASRLAAAAPAK
jgi:ketosteroid isomerase-like protein